MATDSNKTNAQIATAAMRKRRFELQMLEAADAERRRIGQELHDVMGQELAGIAFMSDALLEALCGLPASKVKLAETLRSRIRRILSLVRTEAWGLIPIEIEARELMTALSGLATQISARFAVKCQLICESPVSVQKNVVATNLYRIAQEAVTNAIKHGFAQHINVRVSRTGPQILLQIQDDGVGLRTQSSASTGLGLQIMRFRASLINATLDVAPVDSGGVCVTCAIPQKGQ